MTSLITNSAATPIAPAMSHVPQVDSPWASADPKPWSRAALRLLPGSYLAGDTTNGADPGQRYVRIALVHEEEIVDEALERLVDVMGALTAA